MRLAQLSLFAIFAGLGNLMGAAEQVVVETVVEAESKTNAVPESSFAILFAGLLWFLLLRKRA